jgi:hypothetical protein
MCKGHVLIALVVVCGLALLAPPRTGTAADQPRPEAAAEPDFSGKVLVISTETSEKNWSVLENVQVRKVGGKSFLVGKGVDYGRESNPYKGRTLWIAVDHVVKMMEFASLDDFKKYSAGEQP